MNRDFDTCADVRSSRPTSGGVVTRACTCHPDDNPPTPCPRKYALGECREAAKAAPVQEPVAWHVCSVNSDGSLSLEFAAPWEELAHEHVNDAINEHDIDGAASWVVRPVYASPQPQQTEPSQNTHPPQQRQPLTKVQITELAEQCGYDGAVPTVRLAFQGFKLDDFARAVERAHGIVEAP